MENETTPPSLPPAGPPTSTGPSAGAGILLSVMWLITVGLIGLAVFLWVASQPENPAERGRVYKSTGMMRVQPQLDPYLFSNDATQPVPMFDSFMDAQVQIIESRRVVERAMRSDAWQAVRRDTSDEAIAAFTRSLEVRSGGQILYVSFVDHEPKAAMRGVQATINAYMEIFGERDQLDDAKRLQALEDRRTKLNAELESAEQRLASLAHIYGTDDLQPMYEQKLGQVSKIEAELSEVTRRIAALEAMGEDLTDEERTSLERLEKHQPVLREQYESAKEELLDLGRTRLAINQLKRDHERISQRLAGTGKRIDELNFELAGRNRIEVIDPGNWPTAPQGRTGWRLSYFTWAALSLVGGILMLMLTVPLTLKAFKRADRSAAE